VGDRTLLFILSFVINPVNCITLNWPLGLTTLMKGPNKLECFITLGREGFAETDTLAYWAHF